MTAAQACARRLWPVAWNVNDAYRTGVSLGSSSFEVAEKVLEREPGQVLAPALQVTFGSIADAPASNTRLHEVVVAACLSAVYGD